MKKPTSNPYPGNILIAALGQILDDKALLTKLIDQPALPELLPYHLRVHQVPVVERLYIPSQEGLKIAQSIHLNIRQGYVDRDPANAATWAPIYGFEVKFAGARNRPRAIFVVGVSGVGKSAAVGRTLELIPHLVKHPSFPNMAAGHLQLVWLKVEIPPGGLAADLANALYLATAEALEQEVQLPGTRRAAQERLDAWLRWAMSHYLGALVLEEGQNLFRIQSLKARRSRSGPNELRVADEHAVKWIVNLCNAAPFPVIITSTPDGAALLASRLAAAERLTAGGYHPLEPSPSHADIHAANLVQEYFKYQWFEQRLELTEELAKLIHASCAGVHRIRAALWVAAHRCAFERNAKGLSIADFKQATDTYLAKVKPAVQALLSNDPTALSRYEDLYQRGDLDLAMLTRRN